MKARFEFLSSSNAAAHEVQHTLDNILPYAGKQTVRQRFVEMGLLSVLTIQWAGC